MNMIFITYEIYYLCAGNPKGAIPFPLFCFISTYALYIVEKISSILDSKSNKGGVSPHSGGQEERPPSQSIVSGSQPAHAGRRWVPPSVLRRDAKSPTDRHDQIFRRVRGILNKLTPEKFDKLSLELLNVGIDKEVILKGVILLIFDKALEEPKYSNLYAQLCHRLCEDVPNFEPPSSTGPSSFRRLLLNKCQDEFENRSKATEVFDKKDGPLTEEESEQYHVAKEKMLGNIKFIGELGKLEMLHETILHKCIKQLLEKKKKTTNVRDMAEDLECLCQIMRTVGPRLDTNMAKAWMEQYFRRIEMFASNEELPSRIRFMLQDVIELRANQWKPRRVASENGPRTITAIRQEAANGQGRGSKMFSMPGINGPISPQWKPGFGDIFNIPVGAMSNTIGTGPGVIQVDNFAPQFSSNMGSGGPGAGGGGIGRNRGNQQSQAGYQNSFRSRNKENGSPQNQRRNNQNQQQQQQIQQQQPNFQQNRPGTTSRDNMPPRFQRMAQQAQVGGKLQGPQQSLPSSVSPVLGGGGIDVGGNAHGAPSPPLPGTANLLNGKEELSLRPQKNFMFKPNTPAMLPRSAQAAPSQPLVSQSGTLSLSPKRMTVDVANPTINPILSKQPQITIKPAKEEKPKPPKKESISKEELKEKLPDLITEFHAKHDVNEIVNVLKELNIPKRFIAGLLAQFMVGSINREEGDQDEVMKLVATMKSEGMVTSEQFMESFKTVAEQMTELEQDTPLVKSHVARFGAQAVVCGVASLAELAEPFKNGAHYPLFLLCLQTAHRVQDKQWLVNIFNESKISLQEMLPEIDQRKERMLEILEDRKLSFMFPLLRVQSELGRQIAIEPSAGAIFKWIKEHVDSQLYTDTSFINILMTSVLKYITGESTLGDAMDSSVSDKQLMEKEKELLDKLKGVLQKFLLDHLDLQIAALYAVQVFCYNHQFPKGMLLRFFVYFYDLEIVEEEAFLQWKEEVNDEYPGKGKALFQVNQWLTWLEQAEEESEEEEDE